MLAAILEIQKAILRHYRNPVNGQPNSRESHYLIERTLHRMPFMVAVHNGRTVIDNTGFRESDSIWNPRFNPHLAVWIPLPTEEESAE